MTEHLNGKLNNKSKKLLNRASNRKGYTLAELLMVVAIVVILFGVVAVGVIHIAKQLRQKRLDSNAEIIYEAAQNELIKLRTAGNEKWYDDSTGSDASGCLPCGTNFSHTTYEVDDPNHIYYITSDMKNTKAAKAILPEGAIDDELWNKYWVIEYDVKTANVFAVYFSEDNRWYDTHKHTADNHESYNLYRLKSNRLTLTNAKVGYYEGGQIQSARGKDLILTVRIDNGEKLIAHILTTINFNASESDVFEYKITLRDSTEDNDNACEITKTFTAGEIKQLDKQYSLDLVLDSLDETKADEQRFKELLEFWDDTKAENFKCGKEMTIEVEAKCGTRKESVSRTTNGLFASEDDGVAKIKYGRHLQNLDSESGVYSKKTGTTSDGKFITKAVQVANISFTNPDGIVIVEPTENPNEYWEETYGDKKFDPIINDEIVSFDGKDYFINEITTDTGEHTSGLFGSVGYSDNTTQTPKLELKNINLINAHIFGDTTASAGALVGRIEDGRQVDITNCAVYLSGAVVLKTVGSKQYVCSSDVNADAYRRGETGKIRGVIAGGLVGLVDDGTLNIKECFASTVIGGTNSETSYSIAGGLVGSANSGTTVNIEKSYADSYISGYTLGGLVGYGNGTTTISKAYSVGYELTESGGTAAGLVNGTANISDSYTGMSYKYRGEDINASKIYTTARDGSSVSNTFYLNQGLTINVNDVIKILGSEGKTVETLEDVLSDVDDFTKIDESRTHAYNLRNQGLTIYTYPELKINGTARHYGDWLDDFNTLSGGFINKDTLKYWAELSKDDSSMTIAFKGESSNVEKVFYIEFSVDGNNRKVIDKVSIGYTNMNVSSETYGDIAYDTNPTYESGNEWPKGLPEMTIEYAPEGSDEPDKIVLLLDDITRDGTHFADYFASNTGADSNKNMKPGENITARVANGKPISSTGLGRAKTTDNSLFAVSSATNVANMEKAYLGSYIRHVQNLDTSISAVATDVKSASMMNSIDASNYKNEADGSYGSAWNTVYTTITATKKENANVTGSFYGIYNNNLTSFEGNNKYLKGFVINAAPDTISEDGAGNAGLFRLSNNTAAQKGFTIKELKVDGFTVNTDDGYAGTIIAEVQGRTTLDTVLAAADRSASSAGDVSKLEPTIIGNEASGGLVGYTTSTLTITNSAASVCVQSTEGSAGGLIGQQDTGAVTTISKSYAGGHTDRTLYETGTDEKYYNIIGYDNAGGLVGSADDGTLKLEKTFSAASVRTELDEGSAGGTIGFSGISADMDWVYVVAPVKGAMDSIEDPSTDRTSGAFIGETADGIQINNNGKHTYYLTEVYDIPSGEEVCYEGKTGSLAVAPTLAYYVGNDGGIAAMNYSEGSDIEPTMQFKTYPYDYQLQHRYPGAEDDCNYEYPFSLWTYFEFDNEKLRSYYGDWEPVQESETRDHLLYSYYVDPYGATVEDSIQIGGKWVNPAPDSELSPQEIVEKQDNEVILPGLNDIPGWEVDYWELYVEDSESETGYSRVPNPLDEEGEDRFIETNGRITIPKAYCYQDVFAVAIYKAKTNVVVRFLCDKNQIGSESSEIFTIYSTEAEMGVTKRKEIEVPDYQVPGYKFVGWFTGGDNPVEVKFDGEDGERTIDDNLDVYAEYKKIEYYTITIDFMYRFEGETEYGIVNVPRYRVEDAGQYRLQFEKGENFNKTVALPIIGEFDGSEKLKGKELKYYGSEAAPDESEAVLNKGSDNNDTIAINTDTERHYVVLYTIKQESYEGMYGYRVVYSLKNTSAGSEPDTYEPNYSEDEEYIWDRYGKTLHAPNGTDPTFSVELLNGFVRTDTSIVPATDQDRATYDDSIQKIVKVTYERVDCSILYDSMGGSYVDSKSGKYGQPIEAFTKTSTSVLTCTKEEHTHVAATGNPGRNKESGCYTSQNIGSQWNPNWLWVLSCGKEEHTHSVQNGCYTDVITYDNPPAPTKPNYEFDGWYYDAEYNNPVIQDGEGKYTVKLYNGAGQSGDVTLYAKWKGAATNYTVLYWEERADWDEDDAPGEKYAFADFEKKSGMSGTYTEVVASPPEGFKLAGEIEQKEISGDGTTIVNVYYDRETFKLRFYANGSKVAEIEAKYGKEISGEFNKAPFNTTYNGRAWQATSYYGYALQTLDRMPAVNVDFNLYNKSSNTQKTIYYYVQKVGTTIDTTKWPSSTSQFELMKTVKTYFNYITYEEEYHPIEGFSRYPSNLFGSNNRRDFSNNQVYLYYIRDSHAITYYSNGQILDDFTEDVPYQKSLAQYNKIPEPPYEGWEFGGWYDNEYCEGSAFDFESLTMPANDIILYAKWIRPTVTLTLHFNNGDDNDTITVTQGNSLADENKILPVPTRQDYTFTGWCTDEECTDRYSEGAAVIENMDLYARWQYNSGTISVKTSHVILHCVDQDNNSLDEKVVNQNELDRGIINVGTLLVISPPDIDEYYAEQTLCYYTVEEAVNPEDPIVTVTLKYYPIAPWEYTVKYYTQYRSLVNSPASIAGYTFETESSATFLVKEVANVKSYSQYEVIQILPPEGFENYKITSIHYGGVEYNGGSVLNINATIDPKLVEVYIEPDPTCIDVPDKVSVYDGTDQATTKETDGTVSFGKPDDLYEVTTEYIYYFPSGQAIDAGAYKVNGYVVLKVKETEESDYKYYLLWAKVMQELNLRIGKRPITMRSKGGTSTTSQTAIESLKFNNPDTDIVVTTSEPGNPFIGNQGATYKFSVESFRKDAGTSENIFTYELTEGTDPNNYLITLIYGRLIVTEG